MSNKIECITDHHAQGDINPDWGNRSFSLKPLSVSELSDIIKSPSGSMAYATLPAVNDFDVMQTSRSKCDRLLSIKKVQELLTVSRSTIYNWIEEDGDYENRDFPHPVPLSRRRVAWRESDIRAFITRLK